LLALPAGSYQRYGGWPGVESPTPLELSTHEVARGAAVDTEGRPEGFCTDSRFVFDIGVEELRTRRAGWKAEQLFDTTRSCRACVTFACST
jgi:hypothetical protein